jgi:cysteinyl-tRNA synthetase
MTLSLRNTLGRAVEPVAPRDPARVTMYTCGPTVYRPVHIGNLRSFLLADLIRRALEWQGMAVEQIVNITDVGHMTDEHRDHGDDRMLLAADDEGLSAAEIAAKYSERYHRDARRLNLQAAHRYPRATEHIAPMIELAAKLIERGHAYEVDGTVYFAVESYPGYGAISGNDLAALRAGHRSTHVDPAKRHHADFVLWKAAGPRRIVTFPSPWGSGYPGWHIECSAMSLAHLGEYVDVHTGGVDLAFPHHEDERAQSDAACGHRVVTTWVHGAHLLFAGQKMAKSAGNVWTLDDVAAAGCDPLALRYLCLGARYRRQVSFTPESLAAADRALIRLRDQVAEWRLAATAPAPENDATRAYAARFGAAVGDDLDFPAALRTVWDLVADADISAGTRLALISDWDGVLGLDLDRVDIAEPLPPGAAELVAARERARAARQFADADRIRAELHDMGVEVADTRDGTTWRLVRK